MMAIQYNANFIETMPFSDVCAQVSMTTNTESTWTIPGITGTKYQAYFEYNDTANVFIALNAAVTIPSSNTVGTQQYCEFRPKKRYVQAGDVLHFKTSDAAQYVGVSLRQLPG
jgi:hypothetical protein